MQRARIDGTVVVASGHPSLQGWRILICQPLEENGSDEGEPVLALDELGAALHSEVVFTTDGSFARAEVNDPRSPVRNTILALVDEPRATEVAS
jgi:ethanolamine utilization protein EutN